MRRLILLAAVLGCSADGVDELRNAPTPCRQIVECSMDIEGEVEHPRLIWGEDNERSSLNPCTTALLEELPWELYPTRLVYLDGQASTAGSILHCAGIVDGNHCQNEDQHDEWCDQTHLVTDNGPVEMWPWEG